MRDFHLLSYLVKKIDIPRCRRVSRATPYSRALRACVRGVVRRVIARAHARPKVQPSTGGSEAGSTPTYNCGFPLAPPRSRRKRGCARPNQRGGGWRLRRWRDAWACGTRGDRTSGQEGARQRAGEREGEGDGEGKGAAVKRQLQAGCTRPPPPPRA